MIITISKLPCALGKWFEVDADFIYSSESLLKCGICHRRDSRISLRIKSPQREVARAETTFHRKR